jgi:hypothetical protein
MRQRLPTALVAVAILQFIPLLILPPATLRGVGPALAAVLLVLFLLLGVSLVRRRAWSSTASIFVQGFNIIIRILVMVSQGVHKGQVDLWLLGACVLSIILSAVILYYIDQPDIQVLMQ